MKKWLCFTAAAAIVVVGCGGGGSSSGAGTATATTAGSTSGDSIASVNLPNQPALFNITYLSGQGRAPGDQVANISTATIVDTSGKTADLPLGAPIQVQLNGYTQQTIPINITDIPNGNSHQYNQFELIVDSLQQVNADNTFSFNVPVDGSRAVSSFFPAQLGFLPGRWTSLQVFLDNNIVNCPDFTILNPIVNFNTSAFNAANTSASNVFVSGFLSDYVMFDITKVANQPRLADGTLATRVYFGGDDRHYGASGSTPGTNFQIYTPAGTSPGTWQNPVSSSKINTQFGTFSLQQGNPTDLTGLSKITALQGIWRPVTQVVNSLGTFEVMTMPHMTDDNNQDIVVMVRDANGNITNMYFGAADLTAKTFEVYPIAQVETGDTSNAIDGTFTSLLDSTGSATTNPASVRSGRYSFTGTLPTGFKSTGRFIVFRR